MIDLVALAVLAYNLLRGVTSGLIRTLMSFLAVGAGGFLAWWRPDLFQGLLAPLGFPPIATSALSPMATWLVVFLAINGTGIALKAVVNHTPLVWVDRAGGALLGLVTGLVIILTPLLVVSSIPLLQHIPAVQAQLEHSWVARVVTPAVLERMPWNQSSRGT